ncbi:MAG: OsmC family peroxiredoxin [Propionibacteriaceae bacterium]|jgi:osmotically inducible protein OsmC|nr:OsmC family peroxiredoxin [Propionibacteriaceae bacterium]
MALVSKASAEWRGDLTGAGVIALASSGRGSFPYSWKARSEGENGVTTPEELLGAAHAGCFAMALSNELASLGYAPVSVQASAAVVFDPAAGGIQSSHLVVTADVPDIDADEFRSIAEGAKDNCPVSKALAGLAVTLEANLV